jgi:hypothetical protein
MLIVMLDLKVGNREEKDEEKQQTCCYQALKVCFFLEGKGVGKKYHGLLKLIYYKFCHYFTK